MHSCTRCCAIHERLRANEVPHDFDSVEGCGSRDDLPSCRQCFERSDADHTRPGSENLQPRLRHDGE